ncbi:MAG: hypothetical protein R3B09_06725 [Nannocystaceae bacterium]
MLGCLDEAEVLCAAELAPELAAPLRGCLITLGVLDEAALTPEQRVIVARDHLSARDLRAAGLDGVRVVPPSWSREALAAATTRYPPPPSRIAPFVDLWRPREIVAALCNHHSDMGGALALLDGRPGLDEALLDRAVERTPAFGTEATITALSFADRWGADWPEELDVLLVKAISNTGARDAIVSARLVGLLRTLPPERRARLLLRSPIMEHDARARYLEAHPTDEVLDTWLDAQLGFIEEKSQSWRRFESFIEDFVRAGDAALRRLLAALDRHRGTYARQLIVRAISTLPDVGDATVQALLADPDPEIRALIGGSLRAQRPSRLTPPEPDVARRALEAHEAWVHPPPNVIRTHRREHNTLPGYGPFDLDLLRALVCERAAVYARGGALRAGMIDDVANALPPDQVAPLLAALLADAPATAWIESDLDSWLSPEQPTPLSRATAAAVVAEMEALPTAHDRVFDRWLARGCSCGGTRQGPPGISDSYLVRRLSAPDDAIDRRFFGGLLARGAAALPALHDGLGDPATRPGCAALLRRLGDPSSVPHLESVDTSEALRACRLVAAPDDDAALEAELHSGAGSAAPPMRWASGRPLSSAAASTLYAWLESPPTPITGWYDDPGMRRAAARLHPDTRESLRASLPPVAALALVDPAPVTALLEDVAHALGGRSGAMNWAGLWFVAWDGLRGDFAPARYPALGPLAPTGSAREAMRQLIAALEPETLAPYGGPRLEHEPPPEPKRVTEARAREQAARGRDVPHRDSLEVDHALDLLVAAAAIGRMEFYVVDARLVNHADPQTSLLLADPDGERVALFCWIHYG